MLAGISFVIMDALVDIDGGKFSFLGHIDYFLSNTFVLVLIFLRILEGVFIILKGTFSLREYRRKLLLLSILSFKLLEKSVPAPSDFVYFVLFGRICDKIMHYLKVFDNFISNYI